MEIIIFGGHKGEHFSTPSVQMCPHVLSSSSEVPLLWLGMVETWDWKLEDINHRN